MLASEGEIRNTGGMSESVGREKITTPSLGQLALDVMRESHANFHQIEDLPEWIGDIEGTEEYEAAKANIAKLVTPLISQPLRALQQAETQAAKTILDPIFQTVAKYITSTVVYDTYLERQHALLSDMLVGRRLRLTWPDATSVVARCLDVSVVDAILVIDDSTILVAPYADQGIRSEVGCQYVSIGLDEMSGQGAEVNSIEVLPNRD